MRGSKKYRALGSMLFLLTGLLFTGCGQKEAGKVTGTGEAFSVRSYGKSTTDLKITPDYQPRSYFMELGDSGLYFAELSVEEEDDELFVESEMYYRSMDMSLGVEAVFELRGPVLEAMHITRDEEEGELVCYLTREEEVWILTESTKEGEVRRQLEIADEEFREAGMTDMVRYEDGSYVMYNGNTLYCMDTKGNLSNPVKCTGDFFQRAVLAGNDTVYISYAGESIGDYYLAKVDKKTGRLSEDMLLPTDGKLLAVDADKNIFQLGENALYQIRPSEMKAERKLDLAEYNIPFSKLQTFRMVGEEIRAISWGMSDSQPVQLITLKPKTPEELAAEEARAKENPQDAGKYDADGKRIITLYDESGLMAKGINLLGTNIIEDFNTENEKYTVVLYTGNDNVEAVLADKDSPDIMYVFDCTSIETYQKGGYLADLKPFVEKSEVIPMEDLQEAVVNAFTFDGGLYALPQYITMGSIMAPAKQMEGRTGWTVEEFLSWIEENRDVEATCGIYRDQLLGLCLKGNLEYYIDFEQGTANLTGEEFQNMLSRVKKLDIEREGVSLWFDREYNKEVPHIFDEYVQQAYHLAELSYIIQDDVINLGFPTEGEEPKVLLDCVTNLCILEKSECKEGAFAFLEYCLTYEYSLPFEEYERDYNRWLWTYKPRWEKECASKRERLVRIGNGDEPESMQEFEVIIAPEHEALLEQMLSIAEPDTYEKKTIRNIIVEEAEPYFLGQKELQEVCDIMQSRVSILLSERR